MKTINRTQLPSDTTKEIVRWLTKRITRRIGTITISYTKKYANRGHIDYGVGKYSRATIKVAISKVGYPHKINEWRNPHFNFPKYKVNDPLENFVAMLAHEIGHLRKHILRQRNTEQKVEKFAFKKLQEFRQIRNN